MKNGAGVAKMIFVYAVFAGALALWFWPGPALVIKASAILLACCFLALARVASGPSAPDRALATDIIGIVIIGFCAILYIMTQKSFYLDIAIAWALQSFIGVLALAKYLEGKKFDD